MPGYNYTHGGATNRDRLRFLIGDHRGTNGTSATGWLFSDEELSDALAVCGNNLALAARLCMQCRISRESLAAGVAGTTDTMVVTVSGIRSIQVGRQGV